MKGSSRLYIQVLPHNQKLLEEEIAALHPSWTMESSSHHFIIYETGREYTLDEISNLPLAFALGKGKYIDFFNASLLEEKLKEAKEVFATENIHRWDLQGDDIHMGERKVRGPVLDLFKIDDGFHVGSRFQIRGDFAPFNGASPLPANPSAPSYEYQCMAEKFKRFRPLVAHDEIFLDVDGHGGGRAYFLLEKGFRVIGLDQQEMCEEVTSRFSEDFLQINKDFSDINAKTFVGLPPIDWVVARAACHDTYKVKKIIKLLESHFESRGMMLTIEMAQGDSYLPLLEMIGQSSFAQVKIGQLPSHKNEFSLLAVRA